MPFHSAGLSARERQMVDKLVEASRLLDDVYWRQSDLADSRSTRPPKIPRFKTLLMIMGGRWDLIDENRPFAGAPPMPPGHELYPHDLTRASVDQYVKQHPEDKAAIYDPYTVVKWRNDRLVGVPYQQEYKAHACAPMAQALREAAALSPDPQFANFLRLRADALLTSDYYKSDLAWLELKDPKFDVIFAPYETYLDDLLGVKTSYGASVLIRNEEESRRLAVYQKYVPRYRGRASGGSVRASVEARPSDADGGDGRALSRRRSAAWLPGGGRQSPERSAHSPGEGHEEDLLQEFHGCPR